MKKVLVCVERGAQLNQSQSARRAASEGRTDVKVIIEPRHRYHEIYTRTSRRLSDVSEGASKQSRKTQQDVALTGRNTTGSPCTMQCQPPDRPRARRPAGPPAGSVKPGPHQQQCRSNVRLCCQITATMSNEFCVEISSFRQSRKLLRHC